MAELFGNPLTGTIVAKYPSGKVITLEGRFFVHYDPSIGENPAVEGQDASITMMDPRAIISVEGTVVYRPRGRRLTPTMAKWMEENPGWDAHTES